MGGKISGRIRVLVAVGVVLACLAGQVRAEEPGPAGPRRISGTVVLPAQGRYRGGLLITDSHTSLDCQGSVFDGHGEDAIGLLLDSGGRELFDVTVRNCVFQNYAASGVRVTWNVPDIRKGDDHAAIAARTPRDIVLDQLVVTGSGKVGIYLDDYVTGVTLRHSVIEDTAGVGLYLECSTHHNTIAGNTFRNNGYRHWGKPDREALAVDSSSDNVIEDNRFAGNAAGAIFVYKNCGEHIGSGRQVLRWMHSDNNLIRGNTFTNERVGVWLASRQSRDLSRWDCGDPPMDASRTYYQDYADHNQVVGNTFCRVDVPIRNEGDHNAFRDNRFDPAGRVTIEEPVSMRARLLGRPTTGTVSVGNGPADCGGGAAAPSGPDPGRPFF